MQNINLSRVDLNLFVVFDAIYREGNLTRAAETLNLSQPAVSHALGRLRERFDDPLFERAGKGVAPTPLAKAIVGRVRAALQDLESTLTEGLAFDPAQARRVFTLAARDVMESTALPPLMARLQQQAPGIQLRSVRIPRRDMESALSSGQIDFAADVLLPVSDQIEHQSLGEEQLVVLMRPDHPQAGQRWDLDAYLGARHVLVSSRADGPGVEDFALTRLGKVRDIALRCQNYYAATQVVRETGLLLTLPASYADHLLREFSGFTTRPLPLALPPLELHLYWHKKASRDPAVMWLKDQLTQLMPARSVKD
ncbi:LysR family transcriptional regulator [Thalassolituus sp. LLYu03]|uniref:LysR family transcriptional regulator n=1 Tax=Thalassolituus sp. LLYu03 TaxID=3421656 RepID=UPI003D2C080E